MIISDYTFTPKLSVIDIYHYFNVIFFLCFIKYYLLFLFFLFCVTKYEIFYNTSLKHNIIIYNE